MQILEARLMDLKIDPANVRKTDRAPDETLLASIRAKGLLAPLTVRPNGAGYYVTDGGKRLAALHILVRDGDFDKGQLIPCVLRDDDDAAAADVSLTSNYVREGMHPVDEYEAFARLVDSGQKPEDIAKSYGLPLKSVRQSLALGKLAPEVREAWREDKMDEEAARAFTLETDQKRQLEVFNTLKKRGNLHGWTIRTAIVGEEREAENMIAFVGLDAYKAAGGATSEDLFADKKNAAALATDRQLLKKLYDDKLKARKSELEAEGWEWVEHESDLPHSSQWWDSKPKNQVKAEDRGKYGVIISKDYNGAIEINYGVSKPSEKKAAGKKGSGDKSQPAGMPAALAGRLNDQITRATSSVLEHDSSLALIAVCAALTSGYDGSFGIRADGTSTTAKFAAQFDLMRKKSATELHGVLARVAAASLSIGGGVQDRLPLSKNRPGDRALLEALDAKKLNAELRKNFDAADYFKGVTAQVCKDAIALCDPKYPFTGKEKKSDLAKLAADLVKKSNAGGKAGYLPVEMRTAHYDGPAKVASKPKVTKKKAA